jgi:hypothetical protein
MKRTLTLQQAVAYLPYDIQVEDTLNGGSFSLTQTWSIPLPEEYQDLYGKNRLEQMLTDSSLKMILRPLSDLTKEITVNGGEPIVPMIELAKIAIPGVRKHAWKNDCLRSLYPNGVCAPDTEVVFNFDEGVFSYTYKKELRKVNNQLHLFQKLHELHFDLYGLIEDGLAIDINEIQNTI